MEFAGQNLVAFAAGGLLALVGTGIFWTLVGAARRQRRDERRRREETQSTLRRQIAQCETPSPVVPSTDGWQGYRRFVVSQLQRETDDVVSLILKPEDGRPIARYQPGQYIAVRATIPGDDKPTVRCYSLSDSPRGDHYRISVRAARPPSETPQAPPGKMSHLLNHRLQAGQTLEIQAPRGDFYLREDSRPAVLVAAGIGVTPLLAMARSLLERPQARPLYLFYGVRNSAEHPFRRALHELALAHRHFYYVPCYSRPLPTDVAGRDYRFAQRIDAALIQRVVGSSDRPFYLCGPSSFMGSLIGDLLASGARQDDLHFEAFGPPAPRGPRPASTGAPTKEMQTRVVFSQSHKTEPWHDDCQSLLEFAEELGVLLPSGCRAGNCGMCRTKLLQGKVRYTKTPSAPLSKGDCLACLAHPDSADVVLEA